VHFTLLHIFTLYCVCRSRPLHRRRFRSSQSNASSASTETVDSQGYDSSVADDEDDGDDEEDEEVCYAMLYTVDILQCILLGCW
jgi:hypothetical protein